MATGSGAVLGALDSWLDGPASLLSEWRGSSGKGVEARISDDGGMLVLPGSRRSTADWIEIALDRADAATTLSPLVRGRRVDLVAPRGWVIERHIELPLEAGEHLDGIVASRIGSLSPLPPQDTIFGHRVMQSDREGRRMSVAIALMARARVAPILDLVERAGAREAAVLAPHGDGRLISLYPRRVAGTAKRPGAKLALAAALVVAVLASLAAVGGRLAYQAMAAEERAELRIRADAARERIAGFLSPRTADTVPEQVALELRNDTVSALGALDDLARALPDHSYATEIALIDGKLRLAGRTYDLPGVLTALESSGRFVDSGLVGPTTRAEDGYSALFMLETRPLIRVGGALR